MRLKTLNKKHVEIEAKHFAGGGQAGIHRVVKSHFKYPVVAKIYFVDKDALNAQKRIEHMVKNNPFKTAPTEVQQSIAWPIDALYDTSNTFVGFLMPEIVGGKMIYGLTTPRGFKDSNWLKFNVSSPNSFTIRLKLLYNISNVLKVLDDSGSYVIADMKPPNMMLKNKGQIAIIDVDSFQITKNGKVLFGAEAITPEYSPAEFHKGKVDYTKTALSSSWDYFSFAITAYQILFCIHPFAGSHPKFTTQQELVKEGIWAHGKRGSLKTAPPHANFQLLSTPMQNLFKRCFDDGHNHPNKRPNYDEWQQALILEIKNSKNKQLSFPKGIGKKKKRRPKNTPYRQVAIPQPPRVCTAVINTLLIKPSVNCNKAIVEWNVTGASQVLLNGRIVSAQGTQELLYTQTGTYEIRAIDSNGLMVNRQVNYLPDLTISQFSYNVKKGFIDLIWILSGGARTVTVNGKLIRGSNLRIPLNNAIKKTYVLEVISTQGYKYQQILSLGKVCTVSNFTSNITRKYAELRWNVSNASKVLINGTDVSRLPLVKVPLITRTYQLDVVDGLGNKETKQLYISIKPDVRMFKITTSDYTAEIDWDVWYADKVLLDGKQIRDHGKLKIPLVSKEYKLIVIDYDGNQITKKLFFDAPLPKIKPIAEMKIPSKIKQVRASKNINSIDKVLKKLRKLKY